MHNKLKYHNPRVTESLKEAASPTRFLGAGVHEAHGPALPYNVICGTFFTSIGSSVKLFLNYFTPIFGCPLGAHHFPSVVPSPKVYLMQSKPQLRRQDGATLATNVGVRQGMGPHVAQQGLGQREALVTLLAEERPSSVV